MTIEIKKIMEGRMGNDFRPAFEGYVDGEFVAYHQRKWIVKAICEAIVGGHIERTGDTTARFVTWASEHAPELAERMPENL